MKTRPARFALVPLSLTVLAAAQTDPIQPPPIKMGLWQSEVTVNMSGMGGPGNGEHTSIHRACMTPDSWKKDMQAMHQQQQKVNCTTLNMQQDSHRISFDEQCSADEGYNTNVHVEMLLDSEEAMHGTAAVKMSGPNFPQGMSMNSRISSKYLSADCGDIKPGEQKDMKP
jgi:hypothetical protein